MGTILYFCDVLSDTPSPCTDPQLRSYAYQVSLILREPCYPIGDKQLFLQFPFIKKIQTQIDSREKLCMKLIEPKTKLLKNYISCCCCCCCCCCCFFVFGLVKDSSINDVTMDKACYHIGPFLFVILVMTSQYPSPHSTEAVNHLWITPLFW